MRAHPIVAFMMAPLAVLAGCGRTEAPARGGERAGQSARAETPRTITLTQGDTIGVEVDPTGATKIVVTVQAGKVSSGAYVSSAESLRDAATEARLGLVDPNSVSTIDVDARGNILSISNTVTKR